jgi:hypothetical protein
MAEPPVPLGQQIREAVESGPPRPAYPEVPAGSAVMIFAAPHPEELDRRLEGYQLLFLLAGPPPDAGHVFPTPPIIPMHGRPDHGWLLWHVWLRWPASPVIGELKHDPIYGWTTSHTSRPGDRQEDIDRIVRALAILQRRVPPLGRPKAQRSTGVASKYETLEEFLAAARRKRDLHRRLGKPFDQPSLAEELGLTRRTFQRGLERCGLTWDAFLREPILPSDKIC